MIYLEWLVIVVSCSFICFAVAVYFKEKKLWNGGINRKTGRPWRRFDSDSHGSRGYRDGTQYIWISWGVDRDYKHPGYPIPDYGDVFTMTEFIEMVESHCLMDYDGSGNYSDGKLMFGDVYPSDYPKRLDKSFSHVVWFNK